MLLYTLYTYTDITVIILINNHADIPLENDNIHMSAQNMKWQLHIESIAIVFKTHTSRFDMMYSTSTRQTSYEHVNHVIIISSLLQ